MSPEQATRIIMQFTTDDPAKMSNEALNQLRKTLLRKHHPDAGGSERTASMINRALDVLIASLRSSNQSSAYGDPEPTHTTTPPWAMAGYSGGAPPNANISRNNYTDVNYFKKTMYEMSEGDTRETFTISAFDGHFFRHSLTCYASMNLIAEMAQAMVIFNSHGANSYSTRAVFIQKNRKPDLWLIYADGELYDPPVEFEHDSFNLNPSNDLSFVRRLPDMLDKLKAQ